MKKLISALLSAVMILSVFSSAAYAADDFPADGGVMPLYASSDRINSYLSFQSKTAACKSTIILSEGERWISIAQTLQKEVSSGSWQSVTGASWSITASSKSSYYTFSNSKTVAANGKYRVKSVIVIENSDGKRETVTVYSVTVSV